VQEQLFGVLRAALDASLAPLLEKQQELESRLEQLRQAEPRAATSAVSRASAALSTNEQVTSSGTKASLVPTSYGYVMTPEGGSRRPPIEVALENVGPVDVPDFGRSRRAAGKIVVGLLLAGVVAAIAATILSYQ
jgi:hypothetical protein